MKNKNKKELKKLFFIFCLMCFVFVGSEWFALCYETKNYSLADIKINKVKAEIKEQRVIKFYDRQEIAERIQQTVINNGLTNKDATILIKLATCESGLNQFFTLRNDDRIKSIDRGVFAINNKWHPHITNDQAFDAEFNINYAVKEYKAGRTGQWYCFKRI